MPTCRLLPEDGPPLVLHAPPGESLTLGRGPDNAVLLDDPLISAVHARLEPLDGDWLFTDLGSTNGSLVNGLPVTVHWLSEGDVITLGGRRLQFAVSPENAGQASQ